MTILQRTLVIANAFARASTKVAMRRAADSALGTFAERHPEMVAALFDGPFLEGRGADLLARLARGERPATSDIAAAWISQFGFAPAAAARHAAKAEPAIDAFVHLFEVELRRERVLPTPWGA